MAKVRRDFVLLLLLSAVRLGYCRVGFLGFGFQKNRRGSGGGNRRIVLARKF